MSDTWYVADGNERVGPLTLEALLARNPASDDLVWRPGLEDWTAAGDLPELRAVLAGAPLPALLQERRDAVPGRGLFWYILVTSALLYGAAAMVLPGYVSFGARYHPDTAAIVSILIAGVLYLAGNCTFIYNTWRLLHAFGARPGPVAAVLLGFIPLFSLYWNFVIFRGMARHYNRLILPRLPSGEHPLGLGLPTAYAVGSALLALANLLPLRVAMMTWGLALPLQGLYLLFVHQVLDRLAPLAPAKADAAAEPES